MARARFHSLPVAEVRPLTAASVEVTFAVPDELRGEYDYLLKARISDMSMYRKLLGDILLQLPHANESRSYVVMEEVKETLALPIPD